MAEGRDLIESRKLVQTETKTSKLREVAWRWQSQVPGSGPDSSATCMPYDDGQLLTLSGPVSSSAKRSNISIYLLGV